MPATGAVVIVGMHRSGTSLAAALLQSAGVHIGDRLMEGSSSNPRGHFEDKDFVEFQGQSLFRLGLHPDGWSASIMPPLPDDLVAQARALVERKQQRVQPWGWKDPRTVFFLPLWRSLVPDATFAVVYRSSWEVVDSLFRRGDPALADDPELAVKTWLHYNRTLLDLQLAVPGRCVLANVEAITADPRAWVAHIAERTGVSLSAPGQTIYEPALLHGDHARDRAWIICRAYPDVVQVFAALERRAFHPTGMKAAEPWDDDPTSAVCRHQVLRDWQRLCAATVERDRLQRDLARALTALEKGRVPLRMRHSKPRTGRRR